MAQTWKECESSFTKISGVRGMARLLRANENANRLKGNRLLLAHFQGEKV